MIDQMLGSIFVLAQVWASPMQSADHRPVRVWLGASPVTPGSAMPIYVAPANDGYLLVLRVGTDGRVSVVFPADPDKDGRVRRGSYELRGKDGLPALILNEGRGTGLVLAALSETPFRFGEFSRNGDWNSQLLVASYPGADGPGTLADIAQRMLGDGWFNSDHALYTVRPEAPRVAGRAQPQYPAPQEAPADPAAQGQIASCNGCTVVYQTIMPAQVPVYQEPVVVERYVEPSGVYVSACDVYWGSCYSDNAYHGFGKNHHRDRPKIKTEGICSIGIDCPPGTGKPAKALTMYKGTLTMSPVRRPEPRAPQDLPAPEQPPYVVTGGGRTSTFASTQRMVVGPKAAATIPGPRTTTSAAVRRSGKTMAYTAPARVVKAGSAPSGPRSGGGMSGGAMSGRQMGTALRASKAMGRRR